MPDRTPERVRDAAKVVEAYANPPHVFTQAEAQSMWTAVRTLHRITDRLEREQAAEAKREKRIEELAGELRVAAQRTVLSGVAYDGIDKDTCNAWDDIARALLAKYPALADDGHEGRCEQ